MAAAGLQQQSSLRMTVSVRSEPKLVVERCMQAVQAERKRIAWKRKGDWPSVRLNLAYFLRGLYDDFGTKDNLHAEQNPFRFPF